MTAALPASLAPTAGGWLLLLTSLLPLAAMTAGFALGARWAERLTLAIQPVMLALAVAIAALMLQRDAPVVYHLGGWAPPLGLVLRSDGLSAAMLLAGAIVMGATAMFARPEFGTRPGEAETRAKLTFWTLFPAIHAAVVIVLVANDLFTLFVALEILTFAAVPLVCLDGRRETLAAALRYLLFALLGSVLYLLGVALIYGQCGALDILLLSSCTRPVPAVLLAGALMTAGLLAKTALCPLHLWLPPAHAGAPVAASAILSALVVKASYVLLLRVWFGVMPDVFTPASAQLLALLGAAAIVIGSLVALGQERLKMLVAYSTVAQIGYLFLMVPLVLAASGPANGAWMGGVLQAVSHALAKAAMFLAVGLMAKGLGHDRIGDLSGVARIMPKSVLAFALAGLSLMGVPPSGGFAAKWLLLTSAIDAGQWWWTIVILGGGLLTGGYVFRVLAGCLAAGSPVLRAPIPPWQEAIPLTLALASVVLGLLPVAAFGLVQIGRLP